MQQNTEKNIKIKIKTYRTTTTDAMRKTTQQNGYNVVNTVSKIWHMTTVKKVSIALGDTSLF